MTTTPSLILAIDTSCDDTSVAVTSGTEVWSNVIASQTQLHKQYGGVFPTVAKQAHKENLPPTVAAALRRAGVTWSDITAIAVTQGPGLAPSLEVGIAYAQELARTHHKPLIPVNHVEGHALSPLAQARPRQGSSPAPALPTKNILSLVISGGNSLFVWIHEPGRYEVLGSTVDDAAGECLDKVGRMLGLGYPAGATIEQFAKQGNPKAFPLPLPMTTSGDFNLSFSGLKTAARNHIETLTKSGDLNKTQIYDFCASIQYAVFRAISYKMDKILLTHSPTEIWLGGGVAANMALRRSLRAQIKKSYAVQRPETSARPLPRFRAPYSKRLCMDNAAMIGLVGGFAPDFLSFSTHFERSPRLSLG